MKVTKKLLSIVMICLMIFSSALSVLAVPAISTETMDLNLFDYPKGETGEGWQLATKGAYGWGSNGNRTYDTHRPLFTDFDPAGKKFSVSYDVEIKNADYSNYLISDILLGISLRGTTGADYSHIVLGGSGKADKLSFYDADTGELNVNATYHFEHKFSVTSDYRWVENITVSGETLQSPIKAVYTKTLSYPTLNGFDILVYNATKSSDDFVASNIIINDNSIVVKNDNLEFLNLSSNYESGKSVSFGIIAPVEFKKAMLYIDSVKQADVVYADGKNVYNVIIPASDLSEGIHEIIFAVKYEDGSSESVKGEITVTGEKIKSVKTGESGFLKTDAINFNTSLDKLSDTEYQTGKSDYFDAAWDCTAKIKKIAGSDGMPNGDYAIETNSTSSHIYVKTNGTDRPPMVDSGKVVVELDYKCDTSAKLYLYQLGSWVTRNPIVDGGKLMGTSENHDFSTGWKHLKMVLDYDNAIWSVYVDGKEVSLTSNTQKYASGDDKMWRVQFYVNGGVHCFDNIRAYNLVPDTCINSAAYTVGGSDTKITNTAIPNNTSAIKLYMSENIANVSTDDIELYVNGTKTDVTSANASGNVITVELPTLSKNSEIKVILKNTIAELSADTSVSYRVTDGSAYIKFSGFTEDTSKLYSAVTNVGSGSVSLIMAVYNSQNELVGLNIKNITLFEKLDISILDVEKEPNTTVKLMIWNNDDTLTPVNKAEPYTVR